MSVAKSTLAESRTDRSKKDIIALGDLVDNGALFVEVILRNSF